MHDAAPTILEPFPYQEDGIRFLLDQTLLSPASCAHKLLADEMGLGKTVQAIVGLRRAGVGTALIQCPWSVKTTWARQLIAWGGVDPEKIFIVSSGSDKIPAHATHVILNPALSIIKELRVQIMNRWWDALIVDEAQCLKGMFSEISTCVLGAKGFVRKSYHKWMLSGTIIPNRTIELFPILKTLAPETIDPYLDFDEFGKYFCAGFEDFLGNWNYKGASNTEELKKRLEPFMLRRTVDQVYKDLPPVIASDVYIDVGEMYDFGGNTQQAALRKAIGLKKLPFAVDFIKEKLSMHPETKLVVFAFHREVIEGIEEALGPWKFVKYYGGMTPKEKEFTISQFKTNDECRGVVGQIYAAGTAIDGLQYHSHVVIHVEPDWQSGAWDQSVARVRRFGQDKTVLSYKLIAQDTFDEPVDGNRRKNKRVIDKLMQPKTVCEHAKEENEMSLESELQSLNANIVNLVAAIEKLNANGVAVAAPQDAGKEKAADKKEKAADKKEKAADKAASTAKTESDTSPVTPAATLLQVKSAARAALKFLGGAEGDADKAAKDAAARAAVAGVTAKVGADKLDNIPAEKLGEALALMTALSAPPSDGLGDL